ncbi:MAG: preprotein translocase subunit SecA, partial [Vicinamibacteria bacterium]
GDVVYRTEAEKFTAVVDEIKECHGRSQPVLVGTISIEKSERLSKHLKKFGIPHHVLNAKHHAREAEIVAQAGRKGAVTISTNMAGRGTDIVLGGNAEFLARAEAGEGVSVREGAQRPGDGSGSSEAYEKALAAFRERCLGEREEVLVAGGLHIVGTERHESRRIDNQLRGRSGRQGDPGSSRFYLSLEDDLLRIFGSERISPLMQRLGMEEGEPIEHRLVTRAIENAQKKVEARNFDIRKHLLEYDDVMNKQREVIYGQRRRILESENLTEEVLGLAQERVDEIVDESTPEKTAPADWNYEGIRTALQDQFGLDIEVTHEGLGAGGREALAASLYEQTKKFYEEKRNRC